VHWEKWNKFIEWSSEEVIAWIGLIEDGRFNNRKYLGMIKSLEIDGASLTDLRNDSLLKLIGRGTLSSTDRQILIANIDRLLNAENEQKKDRCTVCVQVKINAVFLPCGHQSACFECYEKNKNRFRKCPICRVQITNVIKTYMNGF